MRSNASVCAVSESELLVFGGYHHDEAGETRQNKVSNSGVILDVSTREARAVLGSSTDLCIVGRTQTQCVEEGKFITLGCDEKNRLRMFQLTIDL